ncbi:MAG: hypothetical protein C4345_00055 [Chloroflexota bacterium]
MTGDTLETPPDGNDQREDTAAGAEQVDLASASRSCSVILILLALLAVFLCVAFAISQFS